jgi:hypothetical protein
MLDLVLVQIIYRRYIGLQRCQVRTLLHLYLHFQPFGLILGRLLLFHQVKAFRKKHHIIEQIEIGRK